MDTDSKRKMVSVEQLHTLLEFMKEHPDLAKGLSRGRRGKLMTVKVWNSCAKKLNSVKDGAVKDVKGWSKYWCDWKYRVRRHALELKVASDSNKPLPEGLSTLSPIEETILDIIGGGAIDDVVIRTDPLGDGDSNNEDQVAEENDASSNQSFSTETKTKHLKRRHTSSTNQDDDSDSPPEQKARLNDNDQDSDREEMDNTAQFLHLERLQLANAKLIQKSICKMSLEICKLSDIMGDIRDVLVKRFNTIT